MRLATRRGARWGGLLIVALAVAAWWWVGDGVRSQLGLRGGGAAQTRPAGGLRIASWNLRNFPEPGEDLAAIARWLKDIDADVIVFEEVRDVSALSALVGEVDDRFELVASRRGGSGAQHLAVAHRTDRVAALTPLAEHDAISRRGQLRPAVSRHFKALPDGPDLIVVGVHLKAKPDGYDERRGQIAALVEIVQALRRVDDDLLVVGDFNATGPLGGVGLDELEVLSAELARGSLELVPNALGCSTYWEGQRRDAWKEASLLDLVFVSGLSRWRDEGLRARPLAHCARHRCEAFRSTPTAPEPDYFGISDHCPIVVDLTRD